MRMARAGVLRAVVVTSIVWLLIDVVVLFYYLDSGSSSGTRNRQSVPLRAERLSLTDNRVPLSRASGESEKKQVIDAPRAKLLPQGSSTLDPAVQQKLNKLLSCE
ncbi:hypothetical protein COOONC_08423 [Cooperia oncophora]